MYSYVLNNENPKNYILFHGGGNDHFKRVIEDIVMEYAEPTELGRILLEAYLQILLVQMTHSPYEYPHNRESRHSLQIAEILDEIDTSYATVDLNQLADKYSYHPEYISRQIKALTGKSITNFARDIRIKTACRLAREHPELRVSDIAYQVGFKDPKYFATSFKRVTGMKPKEFFAQLRES